MLNKGRVFLPRSFHIISAFSWGACPHPGWFLVQALWHGVPRGSAKI